mgnify:CR=1 FL=1
MDGIGLYFEKLDVLAPSFLISIIEVLIVILLFIICYKVYKLYPSISVNEKKTEIKEVDISGNTGKQLLDKKLIKVKP